MKRRRRPARHRSRNRLPPIESDPMSRQEDEILDLLTLQLTPGLGPQRIAALLERFGSAAAARRAGESALTDVPGIGPKVASALSDPQPRQEAAEEIERAVKAGVTLLPRGGAGYPPG